MPRQIIDTESSRPQYVRRVVLTWLLVLAMVFAAAAAAYAVYSSSRRPHPSPAATAAGPAASVRVSWEPNIRPPRPLKENPCCVA
jgi:hypothetical protein